jgi:hypothetical protein
MTENLTATEVNIRWQEYHDRVLKPVAKLVENELALMQEALGWQLLEKIRTAIAIEHLCSPWGRIMSPDHLLNLWEQ